MNWINEPVADGDPTGPDLWTENDSAYADYYFGALDRLPEASDYVRLGAHISDNTKTPDKIFDPKDVKLSAELASIDQLLKRSRDVRLLVLRTQWAALAGELETAVVSVEALADLLHTQMDLAHPQMEGGASERSEAISDLSQMGPMILPLRYMELGHSGVSRRKISVARGESTPHDGEDDLNETTLMASLESDPESVLAIAERVMRFHDALSRIEASCLSADHPHTPKLGLLKTELEEILVLLKSVQPDVELLEPESDPDGAAPPENSVSETPITPPSKVANHEDARNRLIQVETYFGRNEPSSAAVLLVTQARLLIGKSLVDAVDTLMPDSAPRARVSFNADMGFQLSVDQLRSLAGQIGIDHNAPMHSEDTTPEPESEPEPDIEQAPEGEGDDQTASQVESDNDNDNDNETSDPVAEDPNDISSDTVFDSPVASLDVDCGNHIVTNPAEASAQIQAVEAYFRAVEKSSPVPILLSRARSYVNKDFESLLKDILPNVEY